MELDSSFHPLENVSYINKKNIHWFYNQVMLIVMLFIETAIYLVTRKFGEKKTRID